ncbi:MAG: 2-amino-4-hydroxy-6-hydroxymethyldihydropteridine diphosphokinase [Planctomycetota bacterium]
MSIPALVALGGNVGDVNASFLSALETLHETPEVRVTAASRAYETPAVGAKAGGPFLNAAATLQTTLSAHDLLAVMQRIEVDAGRDRTVYWGPRPLDLDLILFGEETVHDRSLTLPHPGLGWRRFVLDPVCEVAGERRVRGFTIDSIRKSLLERPLRLAMNTDQEDFVRRLREALEPVFPVSIEWWEPGMRYSRLPPHLALAWQGEAPPVPGVIFVPRSSNQAISLLRDVLAAALPKPEPKPVGEPLWGEKKAG